MLLTSIQFNMSRAKKSRFVNIVEAGGNLKSTLDHPGWMSAEVFHGLSVNQGSSDKGPYDTDRMAAIRGA